VDLDVMLAAIRKAGSPQKCIAAVSILVFCASVSAGEKKILLRNGTIETGATKRQVLRAASAQPASGLYLLQMAGDLPADWRKQLAALKVSVLRPVPEDAFVVELKEASLGRIEALSFVHWVGPYEPHHKTHVKLQALATETSERQIRVSAVLSPQASVLETIRAQRRFSFLTRYSKTPAGRVLEGEISNKRLQALIDSKAVLWVEPAPQPKLFDGLAAQIIGGQADTTGISVHDLGFDGEGVTVAVADSGLNLGEGQPMHPDLEGRVDGFFYYGNLLDASDEHSHGTHVAGIVAGDGAAGETDENGFLYGLGIAPKAHIVAQRMFDGVGNFEAPETMAKLTTDAVRAGAEIGSNSWGDDTQGRYDTSAMEFDALVRDADPETPGDQPYILEFSAGNAGPGDQTIGSPAVAKNVIATGASQNERFDFFIYAEGMDAMADFSSRGPCEDGRIKPDVVAPGTWIASLQSQGSGDENAWLPISPLYQYQGGTSQAGPQVSGAAAVFVQYYREMNNGQTPSPALVKAALINSAFDMDNEAGGTGFVPNSDEGWGRVDLAELIGATRSFDFTDQTSLLRTGQVFEKRLVLESGELPLKVTLAYTDVPGFPPAIPALVNDLDLEVISPSGLVYRGNQFLDGESVPNAPSADSINNVEGVSVELPEAGEYIVRVSARKVLEDSRRDTPAIDQDFALVFSGHVPFPGRGVLTFDRRAYTVPGQIGIKLIDLDLGGQPSVSVTLASSSQTVPLNVTLRPSGSIGVFTGAVQTALLPVANDGRLHFQHGDRITGSYADASIAETVFAEATGDLIGPVITSVAATNRFGRELITWKTDEPSSSIVYYGTNSGAFVSVTNSIYRQDHSTLVENLTPGATYSYYIVAIDRAGNRSTNNNNGANYTFIARSAATVLLVDAYTFTAGGPDREDVEIPVTSYTQALDRTGVSYEVWDAEVEGSPSLADLNPFRVVIWRINDSFWEESHGLAKLSPAQQTVITEYLAGGGAFLMSSMEVLSRIGNVPFRTNVLQVGSFTVHADIFDECPDCDEDHGVPTIEGADLDSFTSGIVADLDYSEFPKYELEPLFPDIGPDLSDVWQPTTNAVPIFFEPGGRVAGIRWPKTGTDSTGRVVFLGFPLEAVPLDAPAPNNRANLLRNLLSFLAPGVNGLGTLSLDATTYTAPSLVTMEVADSDMLSASSLSVTCRNDESGAEATVQLAPTVRPGVFRGFLTLIPTNEPAGPGRLKVEDGDLLRVEYRDASSSGLVRVWAAIDLGLPAINSVHVEPEYENALVTWETDELTDALVQFGESPFLGKTAYKNEADYGHEVLLTSLLPDRVYYYRVVSRDEAGNTITDDNKGNLYTFRTLKPLVAPWRDNLETGGVDWSVQDGEETEGSWQLGRPNNDLDSEAHSRTNAWGTNLDGDALGYMFSNLISPALDLKEGNLATLSFWHNYDFTSDSLIEYGRLLLFTNTQTQPIELAAYQDFTLGWEREEFDLSPYIGRIVHLVWQYEMFDFAIDEVGPHPGWLVDDVELTITNVVRGRIEVTNNLAEASFRVTGPAPFDGSGRSMVRTNALGGEYVVTFGAVPYYVTPPPQTNTLTAAAPLVFRGNYTFSDANNNRISDVWEQEQFGEISAGRTAQTDSDADGFADSAEFVSGTNPNDGASRLEISTLRVLSNNRVEVTWPSVAGKTYRLLASTDGRNWQTYGGEMRANGPQTSYTFTSSGGFFLFKIELIP
jgi:hypothetical protein